MASLRRTTVVALICVFLVDVSNALQARSNTCAFPLEFCGDNRHCCGGLSCLPSLESVKDSARTCQLAKSRPRRFWRSWPGVGSHGYHGGHGQPSQGFTPQAQGGEWRISPEHTNYVDQNGQTPVTQERPPLQQRPGGRRRLRDRLPWTRRGTQGEPPAPVAYKGQAAQRLSQGQLQQATSALSGEPRPANPKPTLKERAKAQVSKWRNNLKEWRSRPPKAPAKQEPVPPQPKGEITSKGNVAKRLNQAQLQSVSGAHAGVPNQNGKVQGGNVQATPKKRKGWRGRAWSYAKKKGRALHGKFSSWKERKAESFRNWRNKRNRKGARVAPYSAYKKTRQDMKPSNSRWGRFKNFVRNRKRPSFGFFKNRRLPSFGWRKRFG